MNTYIYIYIYIYTSIHKKREGAVSLSLSNKAQATLVTPRSPLRAEVATLEVKRYQSLSKAAYAETFLSICSDGNNNAKQ